MAVRKRKPKKYSALPSAGGRRGRRRRRPSWGAGSGGVVFIKTTFREITEELEKKPRKAKERKTSQKWTKAKAGFESDRRTRKTRSKSYEVTQEIVTSLPPGVKPKLISEIKRIPADTVYLIPPGSPIKNLMGAKALLSPSKRILKLSASDLKPLSLPSGHRTVEIINQSTQKIRSFLIESSHLLREDHFKTPLVRLYTDKPSVTKKLERPYDITRKPITEINKPVGEYLKDWERTQQLVYKGKSKHDKRRLTRISDLGTRIKILKENISKAEEATKKFHPHLTKLWGSGKLMGVRLSQLERSTLAITHAQFLWKFAGGTIPQTAELTRIFESIWLHRIGIGTTKLEKMLKEAGWRKGVYTGDEGRYEDIPEEEEPEEDYEGNGV